MEIPENLRTALASVDDAYLIGLSNKGTVNRAKKDLAGLSPTAEISADGISVTVGNERCIIRAPLGASTCSCPSSAMCRHRLTAILWLRDQTAEPAAPIISEFTELRDYPTEKLTKQLGTKRLSAILFRHKSGGGPAISESTVVAMELPWVPATVRLLEPLEHSTCSCKSRTFCNHKAEALLYWKLSKGHEKPENLEPAISEDALDPERVRGVCRTVREMLTEQLTVGLSRMPETVCDTVEWMAALSHTAGLANLERALRSLHGEYAACFSRSANFREGELLSRLSRAFRLAQALEEAEGEELRRLAGAFRADYERTEGLQLYLLGVREYTGRSGYEGTIYYFIERNTHQFYCYRDLRPQYYDRARRRSGQVTLWGLPCTLRDAWGCAIDLKGPKINPDGGLSSTSECVGNYLGPMPPREILPEAMISGDFEALLPISAPGRRELKRLALIRPRSWEIQPYDAVAQRWSLRLLDALGRDLWLEIRFQQKEEPVIRVMEAITRKSEKPPVFLCELYREEGLLKGYPIECFTDWEGTP